MPLPITCPVCGKAGRAPDAAAGRRVRCPHCATPFSVAPLDHLEEVHETTPGTDIIPAHEVRLIPCLGCGGSLNIQLSCRYCTGLFCSEACLDRHFRMTGHGGMESRGQARDDGGPAFECPFCHAQEPPRQDSQI